MPLPLTDATNVIVLLRKSPKSFFLSLFPVYYYLPCSAIRRVRRPPSGQRPAASRGMALELSQLS
eukprot:3258474-Prymnesium_polylepis.1